MQPITMQALPNAGTIVDPYRWCFPLSMLFGIIGTAVWIFFWSGHGPYPGTMHAETMIGGFFLTAAIGFLMTAVPKFTDTAPASSSTQCGMFVLILALMFSSGAANRVWFHGILFAELLCLAAFALPRIVGTHAKLPPAFVLNAFGIVSALMGTGLLLYADFRTPPPQLLFLGKQLLWYGTFLGLSLGVGTRLLPSIMGLLPPQVSALHNATPFTTTDIDRRQVHLFTLYGILLMGSFLLEAFFSRAAGLILRAAIVTWVLLCHWRILHMPRSPGVLSLCLWASAWMMLAGSWMMALAPHFALHGAHMLLIGSLSLMISCVMTRVTLAHGGHGMRDELRSPWLITCGILLVLAMLTRVLAPFTRDYVGHLAYASMCWIAAMVCWLIGFGPKLRRGSR